MKLDKITEHNLGFKSNHSTVEVKSDGLLEGLIMMLRTTDAYKIEENQTEPDRNN